MGIVKSRPSTLPGNIYASAVHHEFQDVIQDCLCSPRDRMHQSGIISSMQVSDMIHVAADGAQAHCSKQHIPTSDVEE